MKRIFGNRKLLIALAAALVLLAAAAFLLKDRFLPAEGEEGPQPIEAPAQYELGTVRLPALPVSPDMVVYAEPPVSLAALAATEEGEEDSADSEAPEELDAEASDEEASGEEEGAALKAYRYEGMVAPAAMVSAYAALLTTEDMGCLYADNTLRETGEAPDFDGETGAVYLIRRLGAAEDSEEEQAAALCVRWEPGLCIVTLELVPASMTQPPKADPMPALTFTTAVERIKHMSPRALELEGESMADYRVYARDGLVLINDQSCMRIDVCQVDERIGTNVIAGSYYLSSDGLRLYRMEDGAVRELSAPPAGLIVSMPSLSVS